MRKKSMEIDVIRQYYTSINNSKELGVFALSVYLKEEVNPKILQQAANDLTHRLPFLNGRLKNGLFIMNLSFYKHLQRLNLMAEHSLYLI